MASDLDAIPLRVDFAANQTSANIIVRPIDDATIENRVVDAGKTVSLRLNANGNSANTVSFGTASSSVSEGTTVPIRLPLIRGGLVEHALVIRYSISGSATAGSDFATLPGRVLSQSRQTTIIIELAPIQARHWPAHQAGIP